MPTRQLFKIGDMAKMFGVTLRTLRFYEDKGLLSPIREGSNRLYTRRDRARLKLILLGRKVGFSLRDVKQMMDLYDPAGSNAKQLRHDAGKIRKAARPPAEAARGDRRRDGRTDQADGGGPAHACRAFGRRLRNALSTARLPRRGPDRLHTTGGGSDRSAARGVLRGKIDQETAMHAIDVYANVN